MILMAKQDKRLIDILILNFCLDGIYNKGIATFVFQKFENFIFKINYVDMRRK